MDNDWSKLYDETAPYVRAVLFRLGVGQDLDDAVQECFIKVWKGMRDFRGQSTLKTWISRIAVNTAYDHFRRRGVDLKTEEIDEERLIALSTEPRDVRADEILHRALECLSIAHREVLVLHVIEGHSVEETAEILELPPGTVKSRLFHARTNLKKILEKRGLSHE